MNDAVIIGVKAYAKMILHAAKYPYCAVNGVLLGDISSSKEGNKNLFLEIVEAVPLFHHSHYVTPMGEVALTQIESMALSQKRMIVGYYAACENYHDNTFEKCPGLKIADKIAEFFPSAVFFVIDNTKMGKNVDFDTIKLHKWQDGKWKPKSTKSIYYEPAKAILTISQLNIAQAYRDLVDFDNYLDDQTLDWTNASINELVTYTQKKCGDILNN